MIEKSVIFEKEGKIGKIIINRPKQLNALDIETLELLDKYLEDIADEDVRVLIITGSGNKSFVAGADINVMVNMNPDEAKKYSNYGQMVSNKIENLPLAVIAAINGYALGGGCELAMACDIRICSSTAKFSLPELGLGVIPGFGGTQRMPRLLGNGIAKELMFTSRMISAEEALQIGLVNYMVSPEELMSKVNEIADRISNNSSFAIKVCKNSINLGTEMDLDKALQYETCLFSLCFAEADQKEGMNAFIEKRKPNF